MAASWRRRLSKFLVRANCEYSILIEADSEEQAIEKALDTSNDMKDWEQAWSQYEAEPSNEQ